MEIVKFLNKYMGIGNSRSIKAKKNIIALFFLKGISVLVSFALLPLIIRYVSSVQYGIWLTLSSIISWISFFDIGFGNGLKNKLTEALAQENKILARTYVSTTYAILIILFFNVAIFSIPIVLNLDWIKILNAPNTMKEEFIYVVLIVVFNFCLQFILKLLNSILLAMQMPAWASLCDTCSQLMFLGVLSLLLLLGNGNLTKLALAIGGSQIFVLILFSIICFRTILKDLVPSWKFVKFGYSKEIMTLGIQFFFLQIISIVCYQTNNLIISHKIGPEEVTIYNIVFKYMSIINIIFVIIITPFWSAFTDAYVKHDYYWMKQMTCKLRKLVYLLSLFACFLTIISPFFYRLWIGNDLRIPIGLTVLMCVYQITQIWGTLFSSLLYGIGKIRLQLIGSLISGMVYIPLALLFSRLGGTKGIVVASICMSLIMMAWIGPIQLYRILNGRAKGIWNK